NHSQTDKDKITEDFKRLIKPVYDIYAREATAKEIEEGKRVTELRDEDFPYIALESNFLLEPASYEVQLQVEEEGADEDFHEQEHDVEESEDENEEANITG
ncbi:unnamed protein product, partial [Amoebophrya sp. A25]